MPGRWRRGSGREQERGALVGVGELKVVGELCEQDGRLLGQRRVGLDVAERRERRVQGGLGQCELWESDDDLAVDGQQEGAMSM
jgi:hypothetical protein